MNITKDFEIYTQEDIESQEFIDNVNRELYSNDVTIDDEDIDNKDIEDIDDSSEFIYDKEDNVTILNESKILLNQDSLSNEDKQQILRATYNIKDLYIDEDNDVRSTAWGIYYIYTNNDPYIAFDIINKYMVECDKEIQDRDFKDFQLGYIYKEESYERSQYMPHIDMSSTQIDKLFN